jgi:hypothetical protein
VLERVPARDRTPEEARPIVVQKLTAVARDRAIEAIVRGERQARGVKTWPARLAAWKRSSPVSTPRR